MNMLDRIFGRKQARTASVIAAEIESRKVALVDAKSRLASARQRRQDAKNSLDAAGMSDADLEATRVGNEIEVLEYAIQELQAAHAAQVDAEAREALRAEIGAHEKTGEALRQEIEATYDKLAAPLAEMLARLDAHRRKGDRLRVRSREHRDEFYPANIEAFRGGPPRYRATWPGADGGMMTGSPEEAPAGYVAWIDGAPVAKRDGVTIEVRPRASLGSLIDAVKLPGLRHADSPLWPPVG